MAHELPPLPYDYAALEPVIDKQTVTIHHDLHHGAYVKNLNAALEKHPELSSKSAEELLTLDAQLIKARSAREAAQRNLDALRRLQQEGAASAGEVKQAEEALQRVQADTTLLEQKKKDRYSQPQV